MPRPASWQRSPALTHAEKRAHVGRFELLRFRQSVTRNGAFMVFLSWRKWWRASFLSVNISAVPSSSLWPCWILVQNFTNSGRLD